MSINQTNIAASLLLDLASSIARTDSQGPERMQLTISAISALRPAAPRDGAASGAGTAAGGGYLPAAVRGCWRDLQYPSADGHGRRYCQRARRADRARERHVLLVRRRLRRMPRVGGSQWVRWLQRQTHRAGLWVRIRGKYQRQPLHKHGFGLVDGSRQRTAGVHPPTCDVIVLSTRALQWRHRHVGAVV
jgi:hypothetical protein